MSANSGFNEDELLDVFADIRKREEDAKKSIEDSYEIARTRYTEAMRVRFKQCAEVTAECTSKLSDWLPIPTRIEYYPNESQLDEIVHKDFIAFADNVIKLNNLYLWALSFRCNCSLVSMVREMKNESSNIDAKRFIAGRIASFLVPNGLSIGHPESGEPCNIYVVPGSDGEGRYVLENRATKKRSHTSRTIIDLIPLLFVRAHYPGHGKSHDDLWKEIRNSIDPPADPR
jgi:hypothetical protein